MELSQKYGQLRKQRNQANFEEYVSEDTLKEAILCQNPVPDNLDHVKKLDDFFRDILKEKRKTKEQNIENVLEKLQRKTIHGPLSKLWNILEGAKGAEEDAIQISINDLLHYVEQTVLLLGQSSNAITYHIWLNVLGSLMNSPYQVKSMLKKRRHFCKNTTNIYSEKSSASATILLTPSNPRNKPKRFLQKTKSPFHLAPHTHREM